MGCLLSRPGMFNVERKKRAVRACVPGKVKRLKKRSEDQEFNGAGAKKRRLFSSQNGNGRTKKQDAKREAADRRRGVFPALMEPLMGR